MGTGSSFLRTQDDDDILGTDYDENSHGVIKRIPIEMKPRGRLGLRSVSSLGRKPKGGSLRSALSIDLENPEVEKIKKDFEMYRLNKDQEIANMQKKEQKLETENKKLRAELLALQKTCTKLRGERDCALDAEHQALTRAAAFEQDRDKIQRQFKIFRETKESEIQNLLRAKRELENKLTKMTQGYFPEDNDNDSRSGMDTTAGSSYPGDWWTALESEPSLGSSVQLHHPALRGPELAHSAMELEGPFTNVNKDDWSSAMVKLMQVLPSMPEHMITNAVRLYVSSLNDTKLELEILMKDFVPKLSNLCLAEGRLLVVVCMNSDHVEDISAKAFDQHLSAVRKQLKMSNIFLAFLGERLTRLTGYEYSWGHLDNPGSKPAIFCFRLQDQQGFGADDETNNKTLIRRERNKLMKKVQESGGVRIIDSYTSPSQGVEKAFNELDRILRMELGIDYRREKMENDSGFSELEGPEQLCGGALWDIHCDYEQMEALNSAVKSSCELGFERYYERLTAHVSAGGPLPPFLVLGGSGSGRSLLLAKWIYLAKERNPNSLVLCHFVGSESSISADPIVMIRRLTAQLMQHVSSPPALTCDPVRLVEEFPRWLEKVSSKCSNGILLVLHAIDCFQQAEVHLKWLLDPLPVEVHVIVSVHEDTCPQSWRSWPTLHIEPLNNKNVKELLRAELAPFDMNNLSADEESQILTHCRTATTCQPLFVIVLARYLTCILKQESKLGGHLTVLLMSSDCVKLYGKVIEELSSEYETNQTKGLMKKILKYLCMCRSGLNENELMDLLPELTWTLWASMFDVLTYCLVIKYRAGLVMLAHEQTQKAIHEFCFDKEEEKNITHLREDLIQYFSINLGSGQVTCRLADELPWLIKQSGDKEKLKNCILNLCVFQRLYARGRCAELISYWQFVGADKNSMAQAYLTQTKKMEETIGQLNGTVTLSSIADMYETLGRFLKDLGLLTQALPALQRALEIRETALDPDHPAVARSLHQLAGLHAQWGKFLTAEALYKQALEIYENTLGWDHYLVTKELDALAVLYQKQDKHELAEPLKKRAVSIRKKTKTPRVNSGQIRSVDPLQRRALQLEELVMGPDSPDLARTLNELGVLYYLQNNIKIAESFFKRSLEMRENLLGAHHPDIAQSLNNLAALYNDRKEFEKAQPLYERALHIRLKLLTVDHPSVASIIKHLAMLYKKLGQYSQAEPLYKQAVEIREKSFGENHPSVATALVNLAVLYSEQNKYSEAEPLYERALKVYEDSFGPHHPRVAETLRNLAVMKYEQEDYETAAKLYKRATEIKDAEAGYTGKVFSRCSSSGGNTIKNILQR